MSQPRLSDEEIERYARHIVLREIGGPGQSRLRRARIGVIGAGGLGAPTILYLTAAGVGKIRVIDDDAVALSNLQRQVIHRSDEIGLAKTESAARAAAALNPGVAIEQAAVRFTSDNADELLEDLDLLIDGSDGFATRRLANKAARRAGLPLVFGAIGQWEGQISLFDPAAPETPCYACLFPNDPAAGLAPSCAEAGVLGALAGVIGTMMAVEAVKRILGVGAPLIGRLALYDALAAEWRTIRTKKRPDCPVCGAPTG